MDATKAAIRDAVLELAVAGQSITEPYEIKAKPKFATAAWHYAPPHRIYVGTDIATKARPGLSEDEVNLYIQRHVFHEFAHLLWTDRDLPAVQRDLPEDVSFCLFNAFEDARIEARYRRERGQAFEWTRFEALAPDTGPSALLFALVQHEGSLEAVRTDLATVLAGDATAAARLDRVATYFERAIEAPTSRSLFPILVDWVNEFAEPKGVPSCRGAEGNGHRLPDLIPGLMGQSNDTTFADFDADAESASGPAKDTPSAPSATDAVDEPGSSRLLADERVGSVDEERATAIARRLALLFQAKTRSTTGALPSGRLSVRHLALEQPAYRRRDVIAAAHNRVLLILDCSGSMAGFPLEEGRVLVAALGELARRGVVSGDVLLSAVHQRKAQWQRFSLPLRPETIERITATGTAEGLEPTLRRHRELARQADKVLVWTDGQICDRPIDKATLHAQRIYTWGLYCGNRRDSIQALTEYFDRALVRDTMEQLVESLLLE